jgi:hypothetical protein
MQSVSGRILKLCGEMVGVIFFPGERCMRFLFDWSYLKFRIEESFYKKSDFGA